MKQLLFLLLFPCLALAQYQGNAGQKITLGEQTTADGLVYRGLAADTTRKPSVDTMAYILLDTNTNIIWQYKKAVNNAWTRVGGSISSGVTGVLPVENGGTGQSTLAINKVMVGNGTNGVITPNLLTWNNSSNYLGVGTSAPLSILDVVGNIPAGGGGGLRFVPTVANDGTTQYGITIAGAGTGAGQFIAIGVRNGAAATKASAMWVEGTQPGLNIGYNYANVAPNNGAIINGNVGIGTNEPSYKLHVVGNGLFTDSIKVQSIRIGLGNNNISSNFSIGSNNLISNTSGDQNTAVGHNVLRDNTTGGRNAGFGTNALRNNISGNSNMAIGVGSLQNCTDCVGNVAIGRESLELTTTNANDNVAIGYSALYNNTTGDRNVAIGSSAGIGIYPDTKANTTGINNIYIGYQSVGSSSGNTNEIVIGGNAIGNGSNSVTIGNSSVTKTILNGNVGIGVPTPLSAIHTNGILTTGSTNVGYVNLKGFLWGTTGLEADYRWQSDAIVSDNLNFYSRSYGDAFRLAYSTGALRIFNLSGSGSRVVNAAADGTLSASSSITIKENVNNLNYGLNKILQLQPKSFNYIDKNKYGEGLDIGFIAEDVYPIVPEATGTMNDGFIYFDAVKLIPILTKAIQEQQALIKALEQRLLILENK